LPAKDVARRLMPEKPPGAGPRITVVTCRG